MKNNIIDGKIKSSNNFNKLKKRLERNTTKAISDYKMIEDGDRVMVCISGGKDSFVLLDILLALQKRAPFKFDILAMNLDQKQPGFPANLLPEYLTALGVEYIIAEQDTYSTVSKKLKSGSTMCSLCSRLRRGVIYRVAKENNISKIALGHHRDDILATFFLNLFYGGRLKAMSPKLVSDDGKNIVIRPLLYLKEKDIARYARARGFPIIPYNLCGSQDNLQRKVIAQMLDDWDRENPKKLESMFRALKNISSTHLLDKSLFDFENISLKSEIVDGDIVFDEPTV